jgi:hypothetical protein
VAGQDIASVVEITPVSLIGLICAAGAIDLVPARAWPVEAAVEELRDSAPAGGSVRRAAERWSERRSEGYGCAGIRLVFRALVGVDGAVPEGSGWEAGWRLRQDWLATHAMLLADLDAADREAVLAAGQLASDMSSRWSKKAVAAEPTS